MKLSHFQYAATAWLMLGSQTVLAAGADTNASIPVNNIATVQFDAGSGPTTITASATFLVDRKVILTVAEIGNSDTFVAPGQNDRVISFTVMNSTNGTIDIGLDAFDRTGGPGPHSTPDNFNAANVRIFVDTNNSGAFESSNDTLTSVLNDMTEDETRTVFIVANIPSGLAIGDIAVYDLLATAADPAGPGAADTLQVTNTPDDPALVENVFVDLAGTLTGDIARDGRHSDDDAYFVEFLAPPGISVTKTSVVVTDPINCTVAGDPASCTLAPRAIPGATVEYCIDINNNGGTAANGVVITDPIPINTTFVSGSIKSAVTADIAGFCVVGSGVVEDDNNTGGDETNLNGGDFNLSTVGAVTVRINPNVAAGTHARAAFRVTIQ